jgi:hypothetical protein
MAIPIYNQQVAPPHKPSRRGIAGAEARAAGQLAAGVEQVGFQFAGRMFELANRNQANDAANKARDRWRTFWSDLQRDPEYADYGKKLDEFYTGLREELGQGVKFPGAKRETERQLGALRQGWADNVQQLSDSRAIDHARTLSVQSINQAIQDRDIPRLQALLAEARKTMQFEASDLAKIEDTAFNEVIRDQTMDHARLMGPQGVEWLAGDEAEAMFAQETGPGVRYALDADTRLKLADELAQEQAQVGKLADEELDRTFEDLHIEAKTIAKIDEDMGQLAASDFYNGNQKYIWEQRFAAKRALILNLADKPADVLEAFYKKNEDAFWMRLAIGKAHDVPLGSLRQMVEDAAYGRDKEGTGRPMVRGSFVKAAFEYLEVKEDPAFASAIRYIESKASGLDGPDQARVVNDFRAWMLINPDADQKTIEAAANNLVKPVEKRNIDKWGRRTWEVLFGDKKVLDEFELLTREIEEGKYIGLVGERQDYLARYNAYLVTRAQKEFPEQDIASVFIDTTGAYGGKPGTAILVSASGNSYAYKVEGKQLILYRLVRTREGKYTWQEMGKAGQTKAVEDITRREQEAEATAAKRVEDQLLLKGRMEGLKLTEEARKKTGGR